MTVPSLYEDICAGKVSAIVHVIVRYAQGKILISTLLLKGYNDLSHYIGSGITSNTPFSHQKYFTTLSSLISAPLYDSISVT